MEDKNKKEVEEHIQNFIGDKNVKLIDIDDTFNFKCKQCGKCCMYRDDIILNPFDIYNGAKYLGIEPEEFLFKNTKIELGSTSRLPIVLLSPKDNGYCPFLEFDVKGGGKFKCSIHPAKPGACANHPIGVIQTKSLNDNKSQTSFIKVEQCPNSKTNDEVVVRDWISRYLDNIDEISLAHNIQTCIAEYIDARKYVSLLNFFDLINLDNEDIEKDMREKMKESIQSMKEHYLTDIVCIGYMNYDITKDFLPQAEENLKSLCDIFSRLKLIYDFLISFYEKLSEKSIDEIDDVINQILEQKEEK